MPRTVLPSQEEAEYDFSSYVHAILALSHSTHMCSSAPLLTSDGIAQAKKGCDFSTYVYAILAMSRWTCIYPSRPKLSCLRR